MLIFSQTDEAAIQMMQRMEFVSNAMRTLAIQFPEWFLSHPEAYIRQQLLEECERLLPYNINSSENIYYLFTLRLRLDPNFPDGDEYAWARTLLTRDFVSEAERIYAIKLVLCDEVEDV